MATWFGSSGGGLPRRPELNCSGRFFVQHFPDAETLGRSRSNDHARAKNGMYSGYDLVHGSFDVQCEAGKVHICQRRIGTHQNLPRRIAAEINSHDLFVAVTEVTHPAKEIAQVNQAGRRSGSWQKAYIVVTAGGVNQLLGQSPMLAQHLPGFAMSETENLLFDHMERH